MQRINVLELIGTLKFGGAEKQVIGLSKNLDKEKFNVIICCLGGGRSLEEELKGEDIEIVHLHFRRRYFFIGLYKLIELIRKNKIDIFHAHLFGSGFWGRIAAVLAGVPVIIYTEHGKCLWKKTRHILFERIANKFSDMVITVSEDIRKLCINRENTPPEKVTYIPNAVDFREFEVSEKVASEKRGELGFKDEDLIIGTVARLNFAKAIDYMLGAFAIVREKLPSSKCLIVGDGELRNDLENCAKELGIEDDTIFLGARNDIPELLSIMDVFVLSSITEGTPVSLLEAVVARVPAVGTDVGGIPEVIEDGVSGILVPPKDKEKLARGIIDLLKDAELKKKVVNNAYNKVKERFSITSTTKRIEKIYERFYLEKTVG